MKQAGLPVILALLMALMLGLSSAVLAEDENLNIFSCEQQEKNIVMEFVCLDETNTPVSLPLNAESWTVRGERNLTDLKVDSIRRYSGGIHYVFAFESSAAVDDSQALSRVITAIKDCFSHLTPQDCITIIQLDSKAEVKLSRSVDKAAAENALKKTVQTAAGGTPRLYDGISQAISLIDRQANERTVMIILSTGIDADSTRNKFQAAQQLEEAQITTYAVLLSCRNNKQDINGLAPLCVRGGFPVRADKITKAQQMADVLAGLLPIAREVYTLTAHAADSSYNSLSQAPLRVFAYQGETKISGGASLTTDTRLFSAPATPRPTQAAATPQPTKAPAVVTQAPSPLPTMAATAQPATPSPQPKPTAAQPVLPEKTPNLSKYLVPGAITLGGLLAVIVLSLLAAKAVHKKKNKKQPDNRTSTEVPKIPFAPVMPGKKENNAPVSESKPVPQPPKPAPVKGEAENPALVPPKPVETPKMEVFVPDKNVPSALPEAVPDASLLDQTMDERHVAPQKLGLDQTMDERLLNSQTADMDQTMDERRLYSSKKKADETNAPSAEKLNNLLAPIPAADQTVVQVNRAPLLILSIKDAQGTRDESAPFFSGSEITIGRENTDILLDANDHSISRNHLSIRLTASQLEVQDHSGNGTTVNGHLLRRGSAKLTIGSVMELGGLDDAMAHKVKTVITVKGFHCPDADG